ncbi:UDP-N-acetylglucosamine pyrophosphorylase /glucosamine-1-phosphate N-acetyltransferase [Austwickia chelonae]|uniref:Bifunctional protein GlmU n=1 Tax=Austwickia chelonae NBRC 105200 TaxID=1184607 RepID=K6V729_9MICO|nr:bifunctional UDP-N-acetylglucosamine diphosphorylase/glucosamine-1-phosphate N-acetyltransferase GlmU [Austwickia chelonae]GAB78003.1 bifunctional protein GlmU [Austwickia chelonae NBRC 105200]SEV94097.1 UDP-N-acetylglucosamine pyrophosphorylase /glucosamine-1-phosphate N-acetyltransferase [Austwickia chelonae]
MTVSRPAAVIILAAGEGTRMKSATPKVLHAIGGRTLLGHAITAAQGLDPCHLAVVVRHERDRVADHVAQVAPHAVVADQDEIKGTGRAAECGLAALPEDVEGTVLVTYGDVPMLTSRTLEQMLAAHEEGSCGASVITAVVPDPTGYGRILRDADGSVAGIVEQKDATEGQLAICEINSGIYAFDGALLREALSEVGTDNAQGEKYLTDVLGIARARGRQVRAHLIDDLWQTEGVNDRVQLAKMGAELNRRIVEGWMRAGVTVVDPATTWIDADVTIGRDTVVRPNCQLLGATTVGADALIGPDCTIESCEIGDGAEVKRTEAHHALIGAGATVGPFSYLRPGTRLGAKGKIGGFVETKNAMIGEGAKVPHLTYCGDATIGEGANIGAGTIFANYDGVAKHPTVIGKHSFVGSQTVLVAPVTVADGCYVAAGSALTDDTEPGQIAVARSRQRNVDGWVDRRRAGTKSAAAAQSARAAQEDGAETARAEDEQR